MGILAYHGSKGQHLRRMHASFDPRGVVLRDFDPFSQMIVEEELRRLESEGAICISCTRHPCLP